MRTEILRVACIASGRNQLTQSSPSLQQVNQFAKNKNKKNNRRMKSWVSYGSVQATSASAGKG